MNQLAMFGRSRRPPRVKGLKTNGTQRSLKWLRDRGWTADITEKFISTVAGAGQKQRFGGGYRKDLFGFCDILAYGAKPIRIEGQDVLALAIQSTSRQQIAPHLRAYRDIEVYASRYTGEKAKAKAREEHPLLVQRILDWIASPARALLIHGWEPVSVPKKSGDGSKVAWTLTTHVVTPEDFVEERF
jgi:hypothetical protein